MNKQVAKQVKKKMFNADKQFAIFYEVQEINDKIEELMAHRKKIDYLLEEFKKKDFFLKGDKGDKGDSGNDGIGVKGDKGDKGDNYTLTNKDKKEISSMIEVPVVEKVIEKIEVIKEQPIITNEIREVAITETAEQIRDKLMSLRDNNRLDISAIKNAKTSKGFLSDLGNGKKESNHPNPKGAIDQRWGASGGGSLGSIITATDSGDHTIYTLSSAITSSSYYAIINNGMYTPDDTAFPFTVSGSTLTFSSPLPSDLAGTLIKIVCI